MATVKANEKATLPANVEGILPLCDWCLIVHVTVWQSINFYGITELSVTDYAELLSSEPSRKVRLTIVF